MIEETGERPLYEVIDDGAPEVLVERLAAHRQLAGVPRAELEWLVAHGEHRRYPAESVILHKGVRAEDFQVILAGKLSIHVEERFGWRRVMEWTGGDLSGLLPYSRMQGPPGDTVVEQEVETLTLHENLFTEMIRVCPNVTAAGVHVMVDRARKFNSASMQDEKMLSLGRVAAGLAHEINNPAAAAVRSSKLLEATVHDAEQAALALGAQGLDAAQERALQCLVEVCFQEGPAAPLSPLAQSARENALSDWLGEHGASDEAAVALAETAVTVEALEQLARSLQGEALKIALRWVSASCNARTLTREIHVATKRISEVIASIKRFSYMDRALVPEPVDLGQLLADTIMLFAPRARDKSIALRLEVEPDLPKPTGFGGELNQVWTNLIDNAIDAAPTGGSVTVSARAELGFVTVRVEDDGPGIPDEVRARIFDPFFTTKPPGQGTGLGLDTVQRIVRGHRGEVDVSSRPGRTEFRVALPR